MGLPFPFGGGGDGIDKGLDILGKAGSVVPQGALVSTAKGSWRFIWLRFMAELAPQDKSGTYARPGYAFDGVLGSREFPLESGRYHLYLGNPCPWCHRVALVRSLRGLDAHISMSRLVDDPTKAKRGGWWVGGGGGGGAIRDLTPPPPPPQGLLKRTTGPCIWSGGSVRRVQHPLARI